MIEPFVVSHEHNSLDPEIIAWGRPFRAAHAPKECFGTSSPAPCWVRDGIAAYGEKKIRHGALHLMPRSAAAVTAERHNAPHLLVIRKRPAGWYVVRVCACCHGENVSLPLPTAARAARVRQAILGEVTTRTEPKLTWLRTGQSITILAEAADG